MDQEAVAHFFEFFVSAEESFGGGALHEGARFGIDGRAEEIVGSGVANVELDGGIELGEFDEIGFAKVAGFDGRLGGESFGSELVDAVERSDAEDAAGDSADGAAFEDDAADLNLCGIAGRVAGEYGFFTVVETARPRKLKTLSETAIEGVEFHPFDEALERCRLFRRHRGGRDPSRIRREDL